MTGPTCGTPHYSYPESLCTEPAGHYIRERDPHAAPLVIEGRQRGGLAWDEQEQHVTDRIPLDDMTSDQLDALYRRIETLEHVAAGNKRHVQLIVPELERAEATVARIRAAVHIADEEDVTDWQRGYRACAERALAALDQPAPAATGAHVYLSTGCLHDDHAYCQGMTGLAGAKRPGECKHCGTKCICACHTAQAPAATEATDTRKEN